eukprot:TRINITY_DN202_c0_g2_i1.p1 TRINITY_DN202_c0_g2~~TRINITY_DN202_c0_g2_i1.p1  ORF type:complete len:697 (+),score=162.74 TRINITY_DN202_c0_g2_i1:1-2091(+)
MIRRPPRSTPIKSSAASDVYKRQVRGVNDKKNVTAGEYKPRMDSNIGVVTIVLSNHTTISWDLSEINLEKGKWVFHPDPVLFKEGSAAIRFASSNGQGTKGSITCTSKDSDEKSQFKINWDVIDGGEAAFEAPIVINGHELSIDIRKNLDKDSTMVTLVIKEGKTRPTENAEFLSYNQEWYLKKLILKHTTERELAEFAVNPSRENIQKTQLLNFAYQKCLIDCPLFAGEGNAEKLDQMLVQYPKFKSLQAKSTKAEPQQYPLVMSIFDLCIKIPLESAMDVPLSPDSLRKETQESLQKMMDDIIKGGTEQFFKKIQEANSIAELPENYKNVFYAVHKQLLPKVFEELRDPKKLQKCSTLYSITPVTALKTILGMTNPLKMMGSLLNLFLARPLGSRNLLQRLMEVVTDLAKTEKLVKSTKKEIDKQIAKKVEDWVNIHYDPVPRADDIQIPKVSKEFVVRILVDGQSKPKIEIASITKLSNEMISKIFDHAQAQMRLKDKISFIDLMGEETLNNSIKDIFPLIYQPLVEIYSVADMPGLLTAFFKASENIINIMNSKDDDKTKFNRVSQSAEIFENSIFIFCKKIIKEDKGQLSKLFTWVASFYKEDYSIIVPVQEMLMQLKEDDRSAVLKEVNEWLEYKNAERAARANVELFEMAMPTQTVIPKLMVDPFLERVKPDLERIKQRDNLAKNNIKK